MIQAGEPQPRRRGEPPPLPRVEPPPLPVEPPPLRPEMFGAAPEIPMPRFEVRETNTEHARFSAAMIGKAVIKPEKYTGRCEDAYGVFPEEDMAMVNDGVSGDLEKKTGHIASGMAKEGWLPHLYAARRAVEMLSPDEREAVWKRTMIEGNVLLTPKVLRGVVDGQLKSREEAEEIRTQELQEARERFAAAELPPTRVQTEAIAIANGLRALSETIFRAAEANPEYKGMATTSTGVRLMEGDGAVYGIFWGVGDSSAFVETMDPETGIRSLEPAVPTDDALGVYARIGKITPRQVADFENPLVWEANRVLGDTVIEDLRQALSDTPDAVARQLRALKTKLKLSGNTPHEIQTELRARLELPDDLTDTVALAETLATKLSAPHNGMLRDLRFKVTMQALGEQTVVPRIAVIKMAPGTRFRLASDGQTDGAGLVENPETTVLNRSPEYTLADGTRDSMNAAIHAFQESLGKAGADDITVVDGEVAAVEALDDEETRWALLVEELLTNERVNGKERERIQTELLAPPVREALARDALAEAGARNITSDAEITALLRDRIGHRIVDLRLEPLEKRRKQPSTPKRDVGDMAAE